MSRSYRKPYTAITGLPRSHDDKKKASRGVRCRQNAWLRSLKDYDLALVPHKHECAFNNTYLWARDGKQFFTFPYDRITGCADLVEALDQAPTEITTQGALAIYASAPITHY